MTDPQRILSVTELNRMARSILEQSFPLFWISGEISNLTRAASGHWYFSLKDQGAQVRCVMFRGRNSALDWIPREGDKVEARAVVTLYEARGDFQLTVEFLQRAGLGNLFEAYEKLKAQLAAEGLFAAEHKQAIPPHPRQIGIVTSPDAAALRDVLSTLRRRMPSVNVIIYPAPVQGKGAAALIAQAIRTADQRAECDVLIVCRGGGSIEDLWQFNEEIVARAIHACHLPVISAVGHETDFTIADFVADHRAATPTAAAELTTPDRQSLLRSLQLHRDRLARTMQNHIDQRNQKLDYLSRRLVSPLQQAEHRRQHLQQLQLRLMRAMEQRLQRQQQRWLGLQQSLAHLNPHAVLQRGYALVEKANGELVHHSGQLAAGDMVRLKFGQGSAEAEISKPLP
ncbi:Exodeoxyribonuclease VII large subunit [Methylobacillus rhizosphaerae]|uniref:Exodeoxyribonuclease 7 large subunit n=1 Tax=Methylobacillus rhizosphaerae TaxID=551994 RepID=A0A239AR84_9PROT|nr:exodeoxyribonuclease VII large subunit [Methylobacillus rhizosphaerae]SNR98059.1 Exodeoxyribonuclease VII large subunit [Methylobacillus rhizosphaerae]